MKKFVRLIKYSSIFLFAVSAVLIGIYYFSRTLPDNAARKMEYASVAVLTEAEYAYRDLNKNGRLDMYEDARAPIDERVEDLLKQMTLEEKAGMMFHNYVLPGTGGALANPLHPAAQLSSHVAIFEKKMNYFNLFFADSALQIATWCNNMQELAEKTRLGIPITFSTDPIHTSLKKGATIGSFVEGLSHWCEPIGFAAIDDSLFTAEFGKMAAREYRAVGLQAALHPMADLATEPRWGRISGTFGEDAGLSAKHTYAYIKGFQGDSISPASVSCMVKHFPGGGPQKDGEDPHFRYGKDQVYPGNNFDYHLKPFSAAFEGGVSQVMPYYGVPTGTGKEEVGFGFHEEIISGLLRESFGFQGIVCTDWGLISPVKIFGYTLFDAKDYGVEGLTLEEKVNKAIQAGVDQFGGEHVPELVIDLVKAGLLGESRIDESVRRLLKLKFELGLFEDPFVDEAKVKDACGSPEFLKKGYESQLRSQVLLSNKEINGAEVLPLKHSTKVYFQGIDSLVAKDFGIVVNHLEDADVAILKLSVPFDKRKGFLESLFRQGRLNFTEEEMVPVLKIMEAKPTVVVMYMDRPPVFPEVADNAAAILANFGASDRAILDVLFGNHSPEGKLPFEIPSSVEAVIAQYEDVPYDSKDPLFPFGFGLSYDLVSADIKDPE